MKIADKKERNLKIYSPWNLILVFTNLVLIMANAVIFLNQSSFKMDKTDFFVRLLLGFGCCGSWINCLDILSNYENFNVVIYLIIFYRLLILWKMLFQEFYGLW